MKKLIVISVIFALVAGNVFAADVGAEVIGSATLVNGTTGEKAYGTDDNGGLLYGKFYDNGTGFGIGRVRLSASGQLEDGTLGGWLRYDSASSSFDLDKAIAGKDDFFSFSSGASGFVWWKPSDLIKLQIGANADGEFGLDGITRWGFYQLAGDSGIISAGNAWGGGAINDVFRIGQDPVYKSDGVTQDKDDDGNPKFKNTDVGGANFGNAFYGGWGRGGIILNITPVDALTINIGIPLGYKAYKAYKDTTIQAKYNIDGVGTVGITYEGNQAEEDEYVFGITGPFSKDDKDPLEIVGLANDSPRVWAYFGLSSIENVGIDIGIGYKFGDTWSKKETDSSNVTTETQTVNEPLAVGVGVSFNSGSFGLKTRVLGQFMGSTAYEYEVTAPGTTPFKVSETLSSGYAVLFDILPSYAINDRLTFYFSAGIGIAGGVERLYSKLDANDQPEYVNGVPQYIHKELDSVTSWHVEPYISITPSYWSATFFAGIRLESPTGKDGTKDGGKSYINWSVPIGITCSF